MATSVRNLTDELITAVVVVLNALRRDLARIKAGLLFHADASTAIATADATTEPTGVALANAIKVSFNLHIASAVSATTGQGAHMAVDTNTVATATATDEASAITLANALKAAYNIHRASAVYHQGADATNVVAATNASDTASLYTLLNEMKADINLHYAGALASQALLVVAP
jgi:hypothetical protein